MPGVSAAEAVFSAMQESARLVDVACSRDRVWPILTAYGETLGEAGVVFSMTAGERELDYTITVPSGIDDPYELALSNGFVSAKDRPVGSLLSDLRQRCSISEYLIDCGVVGGFKKVYAHFPQDLQSVSKLADMPSMPGGLAENAEFFARYGLDNVAMIGIDYGHETMNAYFQLAGRGLERGAILSLLREIGLPEPSERMLEFAQKSFRIYVTLDWDSPKIERISFAPAPSRSSKVPEPSVLLGRTAQDLERLARQAPYTYAGERILIMALKWAKDGEYLNVGSYYQLSPMMRRIWMAIHKEEV